jgi:hypothetical protein
VQGQRWNPAEVSSLMRLNILSEVVSHQPWMDLVQNRFNDQSITCLRGKCDNPLSSCEFDVCLAGNM